MRKGQWLLHNANGKCSDSPWNRRNESSVALLSLLARWDTPRCWQQPDCCSTSSCSGCDRAESVGNHTLSALNVAQPAGYQNRPTKALRTARPNR